MTDELATLLAPVSAANPAGEDLEYDPDYSAMEKASQGTADQEFGSTVIEGSPPDWPSVKKLAVRLLKRSKDLRIAGYLAQADLELRGLLGVRDSLAYIADTVENYWDTCFPELDPDDDNDPTIRVNALLTLTKAGGFLRQLRSTPIARARSVGSISLVDSLIARGELTPPAGMAEIPTLQKVEAVFKEGNPNEIAEFQSSVIESIELLDRIEKGFSGQVGIHNSPDFAPLLKELKLIGKAHSIFIEKPETEVAEAVIASNDNSDEVNSDGEIKVSSATGNVVAAISKPVFDLSKIDFDNRENAIECLGKIIAWFEKNEPSSPLPMLLRRAKRLSTMSFLDILRDISPDGLNQAMVIGGPNEVEDSEAKIAPNVASHSEAKEQHYSQPVVPPHDRY